jgi:hypothetical protein
MVLAITNDMCSHRNISFQTGNNVGSLFLLIPTDGGVQTQNSNDDTKVNPIFQTRGKENSKFHD